MSALTSAGRLLSILPLGAPNSEIRRDGYQKNTGRRDRAF